MTNQQPIAGMPAPTTRTAGQTMFRHARELLMERAGLDWGTADRLSVDVVARVLVLLAKIVPDFATGYQAGHDVGYQRGIEETHASIERGLILAMWPDAPAGTPWQDAVAHHDRAAAQRVARQAADDGSAEPTMNVEETAAGFGPAADALRCQAGHLHANTGTAESCDRSQAYDASHDRFAPPLCPHGSGDVERCHEGGHDT